jgi:hypothetical protein
MALKRRQGARRGVLALGVVLLAALSALSFASAASASQRRQPGAQRVHALQRTLCKHARSSRHKRLLARRSRHAARSSCAIARRARRTSSVAGTGDPTSKAVGYITDFGTGSNDTTFPGSSIFVNALTGAPPLGSYTTADKAKTVTITDVPVSTIDSTGEKALEAFDTLIVYEMCDIASHPVTMSAINTFLAAGGKVMIFDADRCAESVAGKADYSGFLFPFTTSSPGPLGAPGEYKKVVASTLTSGLTEGPQEGDAVGDANVFTAFEGPWCASIDAENALKEPPGGGFVEATAQTPAGGLAIYEGEDFWFTLGPTAHLRLVFDDMLEQDWGPAGLPCTIPASGISLSPPTQTHTTGSSATVTAKVVDDEGNGVEGISVNFEVTSGPNAGTSATASTDSSGEASFSYTGGSSPGTDTVVASFIDSLKAKHTSNSVQVSWEDAKITATGEDLSGTEGEEASGIVASFTDPDSTATAGDYAATIEWGDGSSSAGTVSGAKGSFTVSGSHTYGEEGGFPIKVLITDIDEAANSASTSSTATVGDAALTASGISATSPMSFSGTVANLTDANALGSAGDFTATIEWGDGTSSAGTVSGSKGSYTVGGAHAYLSTGFFEVTVTITDDGGSTAEAKSTILIFATTAGGSFVIGDDDAALETPVTFWGAQWSGSNSLSGGAAPAAFKGFANAPGTSPACGEGWSTGPGNSSGPPPGPLPAFIAVRVASHATKSGATISGDTAEVVVVRTNAGYASDPGHAGTGTVVGLVCHS